MNRARQPLVAGGPAALLAGLLLFTSAIYAVLWWIDVGQVGGPSPLTLWTTEAARSAFANMAEVTVAVLGVALTVVSIIVELAANRYTPRITDEFLRDRVNALALSFFVLASVLVVWIDLSLPGDAATAAPALSLGGVGLISASLLALLPYFAYVFEFLSPLSLVARTADAARAAARDVVAAAPAQAQQELAHRVDHLGDIAVRSVQNLDKAIAIAAINELAALLEEATARASAMPNAWFDARTVLADDADFAAFHGVVLDDVCRRGVWVEMKLLLQLHATWREAQRGPREIAHHVGIQIRRHASAAASRGDVNALDLDLRFLHTFLRHAINQSDVRSAYNLINEYRELLTGMLGGPRSAMVPDVADRLKGYGQLAFRKRLAFVQETVAYDLCTIAEVAFDSAPAQHDALLQHVLDIDREPDGDGVQESALRGVRKAQVKLATFYLARGREDLARRIHADMVREPATRLGSIRDELQRTTEQLFWEITDRGTNFDWLEPERRAHLDTFFGWFPDVEAR